MLVKAFDDYKTGGKGLGEIASEVKKLADKNTKNSHRKIKPFEEFLLDAMKRENTTMNELNNFSSRQQFINENNNVQKVLSKLNTDDLPEAEGLDCKNSQVGSYISADMIVDIYGDEYEGVLKHLGEDGMLVYCWGDELAWWQRKVDGKDEDGGLVRVE